MLFPKPVAYPLWFLAELAIVATDLTEVIGTAIGLNLLFGIPLEIGVLITALDVFLILYLQKLGFRYLEALIVGLLGVIAVCFGVQIALADPDWGGVIRGFAPTTEIVTNPEMLYLAWNPRRDGDAAQPLPAFGHRADACLRELAPGEARGLNFATIDSTLALMFALFINASILILAAATFHATGRSEVAELGEAHNLLSPLLGAAIAPTLFGIALLCCGLNPTVTATLAGQAVMEGFLEIRLPPWLRRPLTRMVAVVPAAVVTIWYGESGTARLLILSQVMLSLQLSFAVIPLVKFTSSRAKIGPLVALAWLVAFAGLITAVIVVLNLKLLVDFVTAQAVAPQERRHDKPDRIPLPREGPAADRAAQADRAGDRGGA